jgi:capsule polysaccharide export protein KpsC/LpsZ
MNLQLAPWLRGLLFETKKRKEISQFDVNNASCAEMRKIGIEHRAAIKIIGGRPYDSIDDFINRFGGKNANGTIKMFEHAVCENPRSRRYFIVRFSKQATVIEECV